MKGVEVKHARIKYINVEGYALINLDLFLKTRPVPVNDIE
jgi:hypothetical protein